MVKLLIWMLSVLLLEVQGYPSGAPSTTCENMTPSHGVVAQGSVAPYAVTADSNSYQPNDVITVTIEKTGSTGFKGFILQARRADSSVTTAIGTFQNPSTTTNAKLMDCFSVADNTFTHSDASALTHDSLSVEWVAPAQAQGNVEFRLTVVQAKIVYWSELKSETISGPPPPTIGSTATPVPVVTASQDLVTSNGCGDTKGCYLSPNDCVNKDDCDVLVSWRQDNDNIIFELLGKMRMGEEYIAIGFSTDLSMGDDDVWGCINEGGVAVLDHSTNVGRDNIPQSTEGASDFLTSAVIDDVIQCRFARQKLLPAERRKRETTFDLSSDYYMFIARGPKSSGSLNKHIDIPIKSADKIDYTSTNVVTGVAGVDPKLKSHASLMVIGWIGFCSIAIIFARFMKPVWPNSLLLGEKVWFTFHRSLQILNVLCFVTAFILIFVYVGGFVTYNSSTDLVFIHAVCGIIAVILGLTNPIMAIFRPHPGEPKRHVFNWAHWAVGNSAFILAIACIFIGMDLSALDLPQYTTWVFVGWVCFHVLIELFLEVTKCVAKNAERNQEHGIALKETAGDYGTTENDDKTDPPVSSILINLLGLYVVGALGIVIFLVVMIIIQ